jgi:hypothetical protein
MAFPKKYKKMDSQLNRLARSLRKANRRWELKIMKLIKIMRKMRYEQNEYLICCLNRYRIIIHALLTFLESAICFLFCFGGRIFVLEFADAFAL